MTGWQGFSSFSNLVTGHTHIPHQERVETMNAVLHSMALSEAKSLLKFNDWVDQLV